MKILIRILAIIVILIGACTDHSTETVFNVKNAELAKFQQSSFYLDLVGTYPILKDRLNFNLYTFKSHSEHGYNAYYFPILEGSTKLGTLAVLSIDNASTFLTVVEWIKWENSSVVLEITTGKGELIDKYIGTSVGGSLYSFSRVNEEKLRTQRDSYLECVAWCYYITEDTA
ncbi:MAG: hypothetical protein HRU69_01975 [Flammeovirgaceae bacterium]|nr:MAG: hypothetical protein HRU69_01975 [Flammeovirgaceae bacterium]